MRRSTNGANGQVGNLAKFESKCLPGREFEQVSIVGSSTKLNLAVSRSTDQLIKGLSGTPCLNSDEGMLFVFQNSSKQEIWMKDMLIPLDILWLDEEGKIVHIEERVSQYSFPQVFSSPVPAKYVIELSSGSAQNFAYKIGDKFTFSGM
jgi:uncharacterized membrane protein (UPF0127 family)